MKLQKIEIFFKILLFFSLAVLISCNNHSAKQKPFPTNDIVSIHNTSDPYEQHYKDSIAAAKVSAEDSYSVDDYNDAPKIIPNRIKYDFFIPKDSTLKKPFRISDALKELFPGHYYHLPVPAEPSEMIRLEAWRCSVCPRHPFVNSYGDSIIFPLQKEDNITRVRQILFYTNAAGKKNVIVAFESTGILTDLLPCGRFSGAVLSLALFTDEDTIWRLKSFSPALGYYGSFQDLSEIKLMKLGKDNYGCYFEDGVGPGGGPFIYTSYIFGLVDNSFKLLLRDWGAGQANSFANWDSKYYTEHTDTSHFYNLSVIMKGWYDKRNYDSTSEDGATFPDELKPFLKKNDSLNFTITANYQFQNGKYVFINEKVKTRKFSL